MEPVKQLWTVDEVAARWQRSSQWVRIQAKAGRIPATRLGGRWRFDPDLIAEFERRQTSETADPLSMTPLSAARQRAKRRRTNRAA